MRHVAWFSCGAASAVAAKMLVRKYPDAVVVYCDTSADEHPDNARFFDDVQKWLGVPILRLQSDRFQRVEEVFSKRKYMSGIAGAPCTVELKKVPRFLFQEADDVHTFGYTSEETSRQRTFTRNNPELFLEWILIDMHISKADCLGILERAGIALPVMYGLGYKNNNCLGCVKASAPAYWNQVRRDFPEVFKARAEQSRLLGAKLTRVKRGKKWVRIFLDELPLSLEDEGEMEDIGCGPECAIEEVPDSLER